MASPVKPPAPSGGTASAPAKPVAPAAPAQGPPRSVPPSQPLQRPPQAATAASQAMASYGPVAGARADLIYGQTGSTKTTQLGYIAEYVKRKTGKNSRLVSADPGGWASIEDLIKGPENPDGIIEAFALIQHRHNLYETMEKLTLGYWPQDCSDPQSPLVEPSRNGLRDIGGMFYEGCTTFCDLMMRTHLADLQNITVPRSEAEKQNMLRSGTFIHRFSSQTDYGSIQDSIGEFTRNTAMLPVFKCVWTGHETTGGEDENKRPVYGPDYIGKKATGKSGPWYGNMIHLDFMPYITEIKDPTDDSKKLQVQRLRPMMFVRNHIDPNDGLKRPWPAKTRALRNYWNQVPDVMEPRMDKLYELLDGLLAKERAERNKQRGS
jgi:hypothetical protein